MLSRRPVRQTPLSRLIRSRQANRRLRRSLLPHPHAEESYRRALRNALEYVYEGFMGYMNPRLADVARSDSTLHSGILDHLFATLKVALRVRVERAFDQMVAQLGEEESAKVIGDLIGIDPSTLGITHLIDQFRDDNIRLVENAARAYADDVRAVFDSPDVHLLRVEELRKKLLERADVSRSRADLIARDQVLKLNSQINQTRQKKAGVTTYTWSTSKDSRVRQPKPGKLGPDHVHLEGQVCSWNDPPVVDTKTGRTAHPGEDYQCRCIAIPVIPDLDEI